VNIQFKKGVLELCVLSILNRKDCYGYELVQEISKNIAISEGTIYPLLRRLMEDGLFTTYLKESSEGPPRKYYTLTDRGRQEQHALEAEWKRFVTGVSEIIEGENRQ
jgi:PadR family transcriptional regulator PadR